MPDFSGDFKELQVLLAMEGDLLGLHLAILDVDFVAAEHDRDALANTSKVSAFVKCSIES